MENPMKQKGKFKNVCKSGASCLNPDVKLRPTRLRRGKTGGIPDYCSYCSPLISLRPPSVNENENVRIDLRPSEHVGRRASDEKFARGVSILKNLRSHDDPKPVKASPFQTSQHIDSIIDVLGQKKQEVKNDETELGKALAIVPDGSLMVSGMDVGRGLREFLSSPETPDAIKKSLVKGLLKANNPVILTIHIRAAMRLGSLIIEGVWKDPKGFVEKLGVSDGVKKAVEGATHECVLSTDADKTGGLIHTKDLSGVEGKNGVIGFDPLLASVMTEESIAKALAHEQLHRAQRHVAQKKTAKERQNDELFNQAVDAVVNREIGLKELVLKTPAQSAADGGSSSDSLFRTALAIAARLGGKARFSNGEFVVPVITTEALSKMHGVEIPEDASFEEIMGKICKD